MVQKKLSSEGRLLTKMKVPWEVAEASVETVQPSHEDLCKVFQRWSLSRGAAQEHYSSNQPRRSNSDSGNSECILHKISISPDFSAFTVNSPKLGRERSVSCPLGPRTTLTRRRKNTDFDSIIRDISDDSLYLRFKNGHTTSSSTGIDSNNNTTLSNTSSPPVSLISTTPSLLKDTCKTEDDIWTDISLEVVTYEEHVKSKRNELRRNTVSQIQKQHDVFEGNIDNNSSESDLEDALQPPHIETDASEEYWKFTQDVYRTLTGDNEGLCTLSMPQIDSGIELNQSGSLTGSDSHHLSESSESFTHQPLDGQYPFDGRPDSPVSNEDKVKLMGELLHDIYPKSGEASPNTRRKSDWAFDQIKGKERKQLVRFHSESGGFLLDIKILPEEARPPYPPLTNQQLNTKCCWELISLTEELRSRILDCGKRLVNELQLREDLSTKRNEFCDVLTAYLQAASEKRSEDTQMKFSVEPGPGDTGFTEWATAMKMVARLPEGVPQHFRKTLWLTLAEKHLNARGVSWHQTEKALFSESCNPGDEELSVQIVKDLHRTGCSLFCGVSGQHNQAVLKRVLLAFARWNKNVGYCQGLNMLAALILQVMQGSQTSTVKVMIYLIEGVLPESYFGQNLRGLSVDMAVFRDLLRLKLPLLSKHLDQLQHESKEAGTSYEPPLMDVFTMQWFLTIFSNCLPQLTVLRVWDLLFLEGNQVLLKTALAIWQYFSDRIMAVKSADEFYSSMAIYTREMLELGLLDPNSLIRAIDTLSIPEVAELREKYVFNITPWTVATVAKKGLRLLYDPYDSDEEHQNNWSDGGGGSDNSGRQSRDAKFTPFSNHPDREKIALDISVLKKQYLKLRERQRQAHIIFTAACSSDSLGTNSSPALNHLLLGKSALLSMKGRRIEGTIPPPLNRSKVEISGETLHWRDAADARQSRTRRKNTRNNTETSLEEDDEPMVRSRSVSISSSGSSSSSTELCDDSSESGDDLPVENSTTLTAPTDTDDDKATTTVSSTPTICNVESENQPGLEGHINQEINDNEIDDRGNGNEPDEEPDKKPEEPVKEPEEPFSEPEEPNEEPDIEPNVPDEEPEEPNEDDEGTQGGGVQRRNSERALMQILRENSEILRRIQSQSAIKPIEEIAPDEEQTEKDDVIKELKLEVYRNSIKSLDREMSVESDDIAEIRRKYSMNKQWSLDAASTNTRKLSAELQDKPKSFDISSTTAVSLTSDGINTEKLSPSKPFSPFPIRSPRKKSLLGVQLGLYSPDQDS